MENTTLREKMEETTLGISIRETLDEIQQEIETNLIKISGIQEWYISVSYTCSITVDRDIVDCLAVTVCAYPGGVKQGNYKFKFNSLEAIFLAEICEVMYKIISNPDDAEKILFNAKASVEYLSKEA